MTFETNAISITSSIHAQCGFLKSVKGYQNYPVFTIYNDPYGNLEMLSDDEDDGAFLIYESKSSGLE